MGGFKVQGKGDEAASRVLEDARAIEEAGAYALVLEAIPPDLAALVTAEVSIPTIGIGAGSGCDGQVLVIHDMLGLAEGTPPRFVRRYVDLGEIIGKAARMYLEDVCLQKFPSDRESY
jgi:3-methyl-2-oxobutanoate hydroxymethyltransferase